VLAANWEDSCPCPVKSAGLKSLASNQNRVTKAIAPVQKKLSSCRRQK
jgi:hypothetical protein